MECLVRKIEKKNPSPKALFGDNFTLFSGADFEVYE